MYIRRVCMYFDPYLASIPTYLTHTNYSDFRDEGSLALISIEISYRRKPKPDERKESRTRRLLGSLASLAAGPASCRLGLNLRASRQGPSVAQSLRWRVRNEETGGGSWRLRAIDPSRCFFFWPGLQPLPENGPTPTAKTMPTAAVGLLGAMPTA